MITPLFLVDSARVRACSIGDHIVVDGDEGRHAVAVRRLRLDEIAHITDGEGHLITGIVTGTEGKDRLLVRVVDVQRVPAAVPSLTVVQAIIKGDRGELAVEMLTEVGVDRITPWSAQRCVVDWRGKVTGVEKWRRAAREASKQSRRSWFPNVDDVKSTDDIVELIKNSSTTLVLHESASQVISDVEVVGDAVLMVVGPEGGLSSSELDAFVQAGAHIVGLGPTVLRASTAGVAAAAVVLSSMGRW